MLLSFNRFIFLIIQPLKYDEKNYQKSKSKARYRSRNDRLCFALSSLRLLRKATAAAATQLISFHARLLRPRKRVKNSV